VTVRRQIWAGATLVVLVFLAAAVIPATPLAVDRSWLEWMQDMQTSALTHVALVLNSAGRGLTRALTIAGLGAALLVPRRWAALAAFAIVESTTPLLVSLLKWSVGRDRPPDGLVHPSGSSFPSGHAAYAGATCVIVVLLFTSPGSRRALWWLGAAVLIAAMAWSRTYLQVHWLTDVIAGSALGIGVALLGYGVTQLAAGAGARRAARARAARTAWESVPMSYAP